MKYAIIADIHGNYAALEKVLEDAEQHRVKSPPKLGHYGKIVNKERGAFSWGNIVKKKS